MGAGHRESRRSSRRRAAAVAHTTDEASVAGARQKSQSVPAGVSRTSTPGHRRVADAVGIGETPGGAGLNPFGQEGLHPGSGHVPGVAEAGSGEFAQADHHAAQRGPGPVDLV